jgi:Rieske Fe-S protein
MSNYDQERFEDYLEVERYIEDLRAGHKGILPEELTLEQARVYHMAAQLRSAIPENAAPRPEFVDALGARLQAKLQAQIEGTMEPQETLPAIIAKEEPPSPEEAPSRPIAPTEIVPSTQRKNTRNVSRRHLLTGSAVAAASLALGTVAGAAFERERISATQKPPVSIAGTTPETTPETTPVNTPETTTDWKVALVGTDIPTRWQRVVALAQLGNEAHAFQTGAIVGFVMLNDEQASSGSTDPVVAFSAACTHMGCLVHWQTSERNFYCPCHGGVFDEYGAPAKASSVRYLRSLPRLNTKVGEDGYIYVEVPLSPSQSV